MGQAKQQDHQKTQEWLSTYADCRSDVAFRKLVHAYSGLVYASALRRTADPQLAEDVAQDVFAMLARKAAQLQRHPSITGWLFTTTRLIARDLMKSEKRNRDKLAELQDAMITQNDIAQGQSTPDLDEALDKLKPSERDVLLWHYFERMPYREIAVRLGKSEVACRKQSSRAIEKMATFLHKQGHTISATAIAGALSAQLLKAAPAALASSILEYSGAAAAALSKSTVALNSIYTMAFTKTKTALAVAAIATVPLGMQWQENQRLRNMLSEAQASPATNSALTSPVAESVDLREPVVNKHDEPIVDFVGESGKRTFEELNRQITAMSAQQMTEQIAALRDNTNHPQQAMLENILTFQLMGRDPEAMLNLKLTYPDLPVLGRTYRTWAQSDPNAALEHLRQMDNKEWYEVGLASILQGLGDAEPARAFEAVRDTPEATDFHYENLFRSWIRRSPADAAAAISQVPAPFLEIAVATIADNWPELDPVAARTWMDGLDDTQAQLARPAYDNRLAQLENQIDSE